MFDWLNTAPATPAQVAEQDDAITALAHRLGITPDALRSALEGDGGDTAPTTDAAPAAPAAPATHVLVATEGVSYTLTRGDAAAGLGQLALRNLISVTQLRDANLPELDAAARAHGLHDSSNGHQLFAGTVVVLPGVRAIASNVEDRAAIERDAIARGAIPQPTTIGG